MPLMPPEELRELAEDIAKWPFRRILNDWLSGRADGYPEITERQFFSELRPIDRASFIIFHDRRARLQVICKTENMRLGSHREKSA